MIWHLFECTFRLKSPLHVGFHKIMHFYKTRPYVPGKLLWASLTAKLTQLLGLNDYKKVGNFLANSMRFGYLFPCVRSEIYIPKYTNDGLMFGSLTQNEFEKKFINSMASTAIDTESFTAEEGMLHEVEFISPYTNDDGKQVLLKGLVWIRELSDNELNLSINNDDLKITYNKINVNFKEQLANQLQVGGERKYGFGLIQLQNMIPKNELNGFPGKWYEENGEVCLCIKKDNPVWSHVSYSKDLRTMKGNIEPLIGRDWDDEKGAGRKLECYNLCWTPGSILCEDRKFKVSEFGIWKDLSTSLNENLTLKNNLSKT